jgi:hypothetical protein
MRGHESHNQQADALQRASIDLENHKTDLQRAQKELLKAQTQSQNADKPIPRNLHYLDLATSRTIKDQLAEAAEQLSKAHRDLQESQAAVDKSHEAELRALEALLKTPPRTAPRCQESLTRDATNQLHSSGPSETHVNALETIAIAAYSKGMIPKT